MNEYKYQVAKVSATTTKTLAYKDTFEEAKLFMLEQMKDESLSGTLCIHKKNVYSIKQHSRFGGERTTKGCLEELIKYYSNLLSWWHYATPKTIDKLVDALNYCVGKQQGGCYNRDHYEKGE